MLKKELELQLHFANYLNNKNMMKIVREFCNYVRELDIFLVGSCNFVAVCGGFLFQINTFGEMISVER
jgi:hypothetical protein